MQSLLQSLGLTENEESAYIGFLQYPDITASQLAKRLGMDKSSVYRAVYSLEDDNLLIKSLAKDGAKFRAVDPSNLKMLIDKKRVEVEGEARQLDLLIEELKSSAKASVKSYITTSYGKEAHWDFMQRSLNSKEKVILEKWYMENPIFNDPEYSKFVRKHVKERVKKGIKLFYLVDSNYDNQFSDIMHTSQKLLKEVRKNPAELDIKHSFRIFDSTIEIITFDEENQIKTLEINDGLITEMMKNMFWFIWGHSKVI